MKNKSSRTNQSFEVIKGYKNKLTVRKAIIIISVLILVVLSGQRMIKIVEQRQMINQLQMQLENERIRNQQLVEEIETLQSPEGIERIAREQLGLVKPNEIVIKPISVSEDQRKEAAENEEDEDNNKESGNN